MNIIVNNSKFKLILVNYKEVTMEENLQDKNNRIALF